MRSADPLGVAFDATPLLGNRTGVGAFCDGALSALACRDDVSMAAFAVSWRRRHMIRPLLPAGVRAIDRPLPARPVHMLWRRSGLPPIEWVAGPVDVVHGSNFIVPPSRRASRVVTVHDLTTVRFPELCDSPTLGFPAAVRRAVRQGAYVHTPSKFVAGEVVGEFGADPDRVVAVHHGVTCGPVPVASTAKQRPYLLAIGTIEPRKDFPTLAAAFGALATRHPDLRLVVAGKPGWGSAAFDQAVARCGASERVVRLGYVDEGERASLLADAEVFCYPSIYEGFGFPPLEAMAAGVPVVTTTAGAIPEVVGDAALLVAPSDAEALAGAIEQALVDSEVRRKLIEAGKARAAGYTWDACAAGLADLYRLAAGR